MIRTLADVFASPNAIINDPNEEVHEPCVPVDYVPDEYEYVEMLNNLDDLMYPLPVECIIHNTINPLHGALKPSKSLACIK